MLRQQAHCLCPARGGVGSFCMGHLTPHLACRFRVRAENEAGRSLWSPLGEGRTSAVPPGPCGPPSVLGASQTSLTLRWEVGGQGL